MTDLFGRPGFDQFGGIPNEGLLAGATLAGKFMRESGGNRWALDEQARRDLAGYSGHLASADVVQTRRIREAAKLMALVKMGKENPILLSEAMFPKTDFIVDHLRKKYPNLYGTSRGSFGLRETMSVTDYQALYVDVLDRMYYGYYNAYPIVNKGLVKVHQLRDFRLVSRYLLDGAVTPLTAMDAAAPPPQRAMLGAAPQSGAVPPGFSTPTGPIQYQPLLYQAMTSVNWRAFVNDDLGIFQDLSKRLAIAGNRGISKFITTFYVDANGPNANLYQAGYKNQIIAANGASINNPPLNSQGVMDALKVLASMKDSTGDPILVTGRMRLWYGPALTAVAQNLKNALQMFIATEGGTLSSAQFPAQMLQVSNWIADMDLVMDPYIPLVATGASGNIAQTMWGITLDPDAQNRPNSEVGFLTGFEVPQIYTRLPNTQRMGGGVDPMLGDFFTMDSDMKIVTVMGGANIDGRSTVASTGAGA